MKDKIVPGTSCFAEHKKRGLCCENKACRNWIDSPIEEDLNCAVVAADSGPKTLQQIGDIFGLTRMRICQIEKQLLKILFNDKEINDVN